jgi:uncharacterized protein
LSGISPVTHELGHQTTIEKDNPMRTRYTLFQQGKTNFIFTFHGSDGQLLMTSRSFADKDSALKMKNSMCIFARRAESFVTCTSPGGQRYFLLKKGRHAEVIAQSEMYADEESLLKAIMAVRSTARTGKLLDLTVQE